MANYPKTKRHMYCFGLASKGVKIGRLDRSVQLARVLGQATDHNCRPGIDRVIFARPGGPDGPD